MYFGVNNLRKDIEDGLHLVLAPDGEKWVNYLEQYSDEVEQLIKLTRNKRRFYQQGIRAATLIRSISIASLSPPQGVNLPLGDFRCLKNESTGHEMRLSRSFLQANLDC